MMEARKGMTVSQSESVFLHRTFCDDGNPLYLCCSNVAVQYLKCRVTEKKKTTNFYILLNLN